MIHSGGLGDLARYFSASMTNGKIRSELNRLTKELSTGRVSDLAKSLTTQVGLEKRRAAWVEKLD